MTASSSSSALRAPRSALDMLLRAVASLVIASALLFNLAFITTPLCGYSAYLADLDEARRAAEATSASVEFLNANLPPGAKVLFVGEAQVFDARFPLVYNTVFDRSIFQDWLADQSQDLPAAELPLRPPVEIRKDLFEESITHVLVNWREIIRYRPTYGYTDFVAPSRFRRLQELGVLGPAATPQLGDYRRLDKNERRELDTWGAELQLRSNGEIGFPWFQVFPVLR